MTANDRAHGELRDTRLPDRRWQMRRFFANLPYRTVYPLLCRLVGHQWRSYPVVADDDHSKIIGHLWICGRCARTEERDGKAR